MSFFASDPVLAPYLALILLGFLPSEIWRFLSVFIARRIDEELEAFLFVRSVATVLLVGVVVKIVLISVARAGFRAHLGPLRGLRRRGGRLFRSETLGLRRDRGWRNSHYPGGVALDGVKAALAICACAALTTIFPIKPSRAARKQMRAKYSLSPGSAQS